MIPVQYTKPAAALRTVSVDIADELLPGVTITSVAVSAIHTTTLANANSAILNSETGGTSGTAITVTLKAGQSADQQYKVTALATLSNSNVVPVVIIVNIKD